MSPPISPVCRLRASFAAGPGEDIAPSSCRSIESSRSHAIR
eukprot:COSAG06_NODE_5913_length_3214_cov_100.103371_3_plen_41_part_00